MDFDLQSLPEPSAFVHMEAFHVAAVLKGDILFQLFGFLTEALRWLKSEFQLKKRCSTFTLRLTFGRYPVWHFIVFSTFKRDHRRHFMVLDNQDGAFLALSSTKVKDDAV